MKKQHFSISLISALAILACMLIAPVSAIAAETVTETFDIVPETVTDAQIAEISMNGWTVSRVAMTDHVAAGATKALKMRYEAAGWGQVGLYTCISDGNGAAGDTLEEYSKPSFDVLPANFDKWDSIDGHIYAPFNECVKNQVPSGLQVILVGADFKALAVTKIWFEEGEWWVNDLTKKVDKDFSLKPEDFCKITDDSFVNVLNDTTVYTEHMTAFPKATYLAFRVCGGGPDHWDSENSKWDSSYVNDYCTGEYNERDRYKDITVYLSGMKVVREVTEEEKKQEEEEQKKEEEEKKDDPKTDPKDDPKTDPKNDKPAASKSNNPEAPTDNYKHTYFRGLEEADQAWADSLTTVSTNKVVAGITDKQYVAYGAKSALKIEHLGKDGWSMTIFTPKDASGNFNKTFDVVPGNLPDYDGIRFYAKLVAKDGSHLPQAFTMRLLNEWSQEIAVATVKCYDTDGIFSDWIYLTPADFGYPLGFPAAFTMEFKTDGTVDPDDGSCNYDFYISGLSCYKKTGGGSGNGTATGGEDSPNAATGVENHTASAVAFAGGAVLLMGGIVLLNKKRREN